MNKASLVSFLLVTITLFSCNKEVIIQQGDSNTPTANQSLSSETISEVTEKPVEETPFVGNGQAVIIYNLDKIYDINSAGFVNGRITDAQQGASLPLSGVEISFTNSETGETTFTTTTNQSGLYETPLLPAAKYFVNIKKADYISVVNVPLLIEEGKSKESNFHLSRLLKSDELRIVLSWKSSAPGVARDIDGRLYIDGEDKPVYFLNQKSKDLHSAILDIDDQDFVGPETITIKKDLSQSFSYVVNNYDRFSEVDGVKGELGLSGVRVQVFNNNQMIKNYLIPEMKSEQRQSGDWFSVFNLSVDQDGQVSIEDKMIYSDEKKQ